jgi:nucleoid-associated protein YgaU
VLFHVQSEDSGRAHPHIITHLYHGGTILFSEKSSYAELLEESDLSARVRERMETQHRKVLEQLRAGGFDQTIRDRLGSVFGDEENRGTRPIDTTETGSGQATEPPSPGSAAPEAPAPAAAPDAARGFGEGIVSAKPLDEVILEYLVENARKRRQKPAS